MEKIQRYNLTKIEEKLQKELDSERFRHTRGVMYTSAALAMCYAEDLEKAQAAGLLHDCAKCITNDKKLKLCDKYHIEISSAEAAAPSLLHAKLGAKLAETQYGVSDEEILNAIRYHTTGRPAMTRLEKIVFMADYIEPLRNKAENLLQIRRTAFHDLDFAVYMTLRDTLLFLENRKEMMDHTTEAAYVYYKDLVENRHLLRHDEDE